MNSIETYSEHEVIERILNGEKALYELVVRRYNPYLYKIGRSYNYNHDDTQDLMQDTYVDAYKNLRQYEGRSSFKTWISRIMLNNCYRKNSKLSYKNEVMKDDINEQAVPMFTSSNNDTGKVVHNRELGSIIETALSKIPEEYRMVFTLREVNDMSVAETAELLNLSETNVKVRLSRAKNMLREELEKSYTAKDLYEFNLVYCDAMVNRVMDKIKDL